jgi:hypothetical protein
MARPAPGNFHTHRDGKDFFGGYAYMSQGPLPVAWAGVQSSKRGLWGQRLIDEMKNYNHQVGLKIVGECMRRHLPSQRAPGKVAAGALAFFDVGAIYGAAGRVRARRDAPSRFGRSSGGAPRASDIAPVKRTAAITPLRGC